MDNYVGKHLLIDCYGCREEIIDSAEGLSLLLASAAEEVSMTVRDTFVYHDEDEFTLAAYGEKSHICMHAYPEMRYAAIDIYSFTESITPTTAMKVFQRALRPEKIRATSVKRGNLDAHPDMKPQTRSKTTTMRKFKDTGRQVSAAGKKMIHFIRRTHGPRNDTMD